MNTENVAGELVSGNEGLVDGTMAVVCTVGGIMVAVCTIAVVAITNGFQVRKDRLTGEVYIVFTQHTQARLSYKRTDLTKGHKEFGLSTPSSFDVLDMLQKTS